MNKQINQSHPDEQPGLVEKLEQKIMDLEIRMSYQDESLQAMEKTLALQHQTIQQLTHKLHLLTDFLKSLRDEPIKPLSEETPPPHY